MVSQFLITQNIDGTRYTGTLCARDWNHAIEMATRIGAKVEGTLEQEQCANCGQVLTASSDTADPTFFDHVSEIDV